MKSNSKNIQDALDEHLDAIHDFINQSLKNDIQKITALLALYALEAAISKINNPSLTKKSQPRPSHPPHLSC